MTVHIRDATIWDAADIEAVHYASREAAFGDQVPRAAFRALGPEERLARWREWLANPEISAIVGEEGGEIVGFATVRRATDADLNGGIIAEMPTLYVHPAAWGKGYGLALCAATEIRAAQAGYVELILWVLEINQRARRFYERNGFWHDGARKRDDGPVPTTLVALRYRKPLGAPGRHLS